MTIHTIGHSTHEINEFVSILKKYNIETLVDIRSFPMSRHVPQFNKEFLQTFLPTKNINYFHLRILGGRRSTTKQSVNKRWRNGSFRGYADYMQTNDFIEGINALTEIANVSSVCIMCAEAVPWRCHRSLVSDALIVRKIKVIDIFSIQKSEERTIHSFACVNDMQITYP